MEIQEEKTTLQEIMAVRTVCELDDIIGELEDESFEPVADKAISDTLTVIHRHFYLVPRSLVNADGSLNFREPPEDALTQNIADLWNQVSS